MKTNKFLLLILIAVFIFLVAVYLVGKPATLLADTAYLFPVFVSALAGFYAAGAFGFKSYNGKALLLIAFGLTSWAAGELIWYIFKNFLNIDPFPSIADFFFLLAYPLLFLGILFGTRLARANWSQLNKKTAWADIAAVAVLAAAVSYWGIYKAYDPQTNIFENLILMSYGIADLILIGALILSLGTARAFKGGRFGFLWKVLTGGFFFILVA
ncbi:MAG: hypothetical protein PHP25_05440, partial [Candidatus Moranbacteria bacterium]|nr:hypothetical protein [Candidatus Moranbacteria bacterium]